MEGHGADGGIGGRGVGDAAVDFHVGFGGEERAAVGADGVCCGCFVGGEDVEVVGEEGSAVDVEEAGDLGELGLVGAGGGGGVVGEVFFRVRGLVGDWGWGGTPDLGRGVLGWSVGGVPRGRERLLCGVHFGVGKGWSQTITAS